MTASPYLSWSRISRWKFQRDWPTGRNTGNNYYLPGVSYVFIVPGTRTVWLAFYAASTVPTLHLTILLSRRANSRESPTNRCFQIPKALRCMFTAPVGLFPAEELFPRYLVFFHRISGHCHYNNYFELCRTELFRSSKFCKIYVSISRCVFCWKFVKKVDQELVKLVSSVKSI